MSKLGKKKALQVTSVVLILLIAFSILFVSILKTASITPSFTQAPLTEEQRLAQRYGNKEISELIDYELVYPGTVLPGHPLWFAKVLRDQLWLAMTTNSTRKAELSLLFADKRLSAARQLFENKDYENGYTTLAKAEYYLQRAIDLEEQSRGQGADTISVLNRIANASLKHRFIVQDLLLVTPEDARADVVLLERIPIGVYGRAAAGLESLELTPPYNPFIGE